MLRTISRKKLNYGLIIDIGSGSVGAALIATRGQSSSTKTLWSVREQIPHHLIDNRDVLQGIERALKHVFTACGSTCLSALRSHDPKGSITHICVSVSAPWSYTFTKKVRVSHPSEFTITESLIKNAEQTARKKVDAEVASLSTHKDEKLSVVSHSTVAVLSKGYRISEPLGESASTVDLLQLFSIVNAQLADSITECVERFFPNTKLSMQSFISRFYSALSDLPVDTSEVCLADITDEASEFAIVRDGMLVHATHVPKGTRALTYEMARRCNIPQREAYSYFQENRTITSESHRNALEEICTEFETDILNELLNDTTLKKIPHTIVLHSKDHTESFLIERLTKSMKQTGRMGNMVRIAMPLQMNTTSDIDSALLLSAFVFQNSVRQ